MRVTQPFDASTLLSIDPELCRRVDFAQGNESFDLAQDRELVERLVEWQMGVFRQPTKWGYWEFMVRWVGANWSRGQQEGEGEKSKFSFILVLAARFCPFERMYLCHQTADEARQS